MSGQLGGGFKVKHIQDLFISLDEAISALKSNYRIVLFAVDFELTVAEEEAVDGFKSGKESRASTSRELAQKILNLKPDIFNNLIGSIDDLMRSLNRISTNHHAMLMMEDVSEKAFQDLSKLAGTYCDSLEKVADKLEAVNLQGTLDRYLYQLTDQKLNRPGIAGGSNS